MLACIGAAALTMGVLGAVASPAAGAKGGQSAVTAAANDHSNPNADDHGNGNGPPANGSVGNADDHNPPGQSNGDHNRGYECDDNKGVGNGNPAHSGTCSNGGGEGTSGGGGGNTTVPPNVTPTTAAPTATPPTAEVLGENLTKPEAVQPAELARTGANATGLLTVAGFAMVLLGLLLVTATRRQEVTS